MDIKIGNSKEEQYIRNELQSLKKSYDELKAADKIQGIEINLLSKKIDKLISALQGVTSSKNEAKDSRNKIDFISRGDSNASEADTHTCRCEGSCQPSNIAKNESVKNESLDSKGVFIDYPLFSKIINCLHITATDESKELIDQLIDLGKKSMEHINRLDKVRITPNLNESVLCYPVKNHPMEDEHKPESKSKKQFPSAFDTAVENAAKDASKKICNIIDDIAKKKSALKDIDKKTTNNIRIFDDDAHHVHANEDKKQDTTESVISNIRKSGSLKEDSDKIIHPVDKAKKQRRITLSEEELKELFNDVKEGLLLDELDLFGIPAETIREWLNTKHKNKSQGTYKIGKTTSSDSRKDKNRSSFPHRHRSCFDFD